jgi:hypothetical protein
MSKLPGEIKERFHGAGKCQVKSKCLNAKTYPGRLPVGETPNGATQAVKAFNGFGHLIFDIDLTLGFWNLTLNRVSQEIHK